jgi:peptidoglycan/LPS O-acetylase OafA/YrhL
MRVSQNQPGLRQRPLSWRYSPRLALRFSLTSAGSGRPAAGNDGRPAARLTFLDGLRGWAAVAVLLFHVFILVFPPSIFAAVTLRKFVLFNGAFAVMLFFVISGFALSAPFVASASRKTILRLAAGRYFRLAIPVFAACALVHVAMCAGWVGPASSRPAAHFVHLLRFGLVDVFLDYRPDESYIPALWTMQIEFTGSVVVLCLQATMGSPLFRGRVTRAWRSMIYLGMAMVLLDRGSFLALFVIGMVLADNQSALTSSSLRRLAPVLLAMGVGMPLVLPFDSIAPPSMLAPVLFLVGSAAMSPTRRFLSNSFSRELGRLSFPLYLIHGPVLLVGIPLTAGASGSGLLIADLALVAVSLGAAILFAPVNVGGILAARWVGDSTVALVGRLLNRHIPDGRLSDPGRGAKGQHSVCPPPVAASWVMPGPPCADGSHCLTR